jgi:hypothetical protein
MDKDLLTRKCLPCLALILINSFVLFMSNTSHADTLKSLRHRLPRQINDWSAEPQDRIFDKKTIFSYIDGGAEVYKAYNMQQCLSRRYSTPNGPTIILDIFDMGSSEDAFGVFNHDTEGKPVNIGQDARFRSGWLSFWKNRFFVSIYMEEETAEAEKAVERLGRQVAALILQEGTRPRILLKLPSEGLVSGSTRYLHNPIVLNYHFYVSDENVLNIAADTDAVLARYQMGTEEAQLLLVSYPDFKLARKALASFLNHYLPDSDQVDIALLEDGKWSGASLKGKLLAVVLEADSRQLAESLLKPFF